MRMYGTNWWSASPRREPLRPFTIECIRGLSASRSTHRLRFAYQVASPPNAARWISLPMCSEGCRRVFVSGSCTCVVCNDCSPRRKLYPVPVWGHCRPWLWCAAAARRAIDQLAVRIRVQTVGATTRPRAGHAADVLLGPQQCMCVFSSGNLAWAFFVSECASLKLACRTMCEHIHYVARVCVLW